MILPLKIYRKQPYYKTNKDEKNSTRKVEIQ